MIRKKYFLLFLSLLVMSASYAFKKAKPRLLVFSKTAGFRHDAIPVGKLAMLQMGAENGFDVDTTEDASVFTAKNLKRYKAIVFLSTTGNILNDEQQAAMESYIKKGGGYVGIHAATDTEYDWPWYNQLVGAYFLSHPNQQTATLQVVDRTHPATKHLDATWIRKDEWYNFKSIVPGLHVLIKIDEKSYTGGKNGDDHPMSWYREFDGGRMFYTELGHTKESYKEEAFLKHVLGGIEYVIGKKK
ncbi:ThuA domain-containing protein [Chitinophaga sp. SYP-B3965]|uniref:ThuA domain-containing protein n=1 Tax=Chitinophaga sp. SYP-B3965 TaxID=2663120 RepID=UPI00129A0865|nr:ThuA domain-containing protein [Chitinophaga sp. SYP-B3965]MRG48854.1 ThuA domain-containing protein [Chitinophaga sp. SYP-B3965]